MNNFKLITSAIVFLSVCFFSSCKRSDDDYFPSKYQNVMRENALAEAFADDVLKVAENILMNNSNAKIGTAGASLGCITDVDTVVTGANTKTYTIVFSSSCTSYDGKVRSGTMKIDLVGSNYNTSGSSITIRFENFYINSNQFIGKIVSTNQGSGVFKVVVGNEADTDYAALVFSDGKRTHWKSTHKRSIFEGNADNIIINNKYKISAFDPGLSPVEGVSTDGNYYSGEIISDLLLDYSCIASGNLRYPSGGEIELRVGNNFRTVSYGDGSCSGNNMADLKVSSAVGNFALY